MKLPSTRLFLERNNLVRIKIDRSNKGGNVCNFRRFSKFENILNGSL